MFDPYSASGEDNPEEWRCIIQTSESESVFRCLRATEAECLETGYQQLWLYAMRHYPPVPPDPKNNDHLLAKPTRAKPDPELCNGKYMFGEVNMVSPNYPARCPFHR